MRVNSFRRESMISQTVDSCLRRACHEDGGMTDGSFGIYLILIPKGRFVFNFGLSGDKHLPSACHLGHSYLRVFPKCKNKTWIRRGALPSVPSSICCTHSGSFGARVCRSAKNRMLILMTKKYGRFSIHPRFHPSILSGESGAFA